MPNSLDDLLARFDAELPLAEARTIPAAWYLDGDLAERERQRVFAGTWQAVGRSDQVARPGSYFTTDLAGEPLVVVRDPEGTLRAFYNVCRHRGARVAGDPEGSCSRFRCRYHGWTYDLAGRLRGTPEFEGVADFRREENGLAALAVAEWGPFVWAHLGTNPEPLGEWLTPLTRRGLEGTLSSLRFTARREYRLACNWKVFVDNYLDGGYHVHTVHPGLASVLDYSQYRTEIDAHASFQISPLTTPPSPPSGGESADVPAVRQGNVAWYVWIFPNFMINLYEGVLDTNLVLPEGPNACRVIFDFYFAGQDADWIATSIAVADRVQHEDITICEEVQRGLASRSYDTGRFSVRREAGGYHFHQLLARRLREARG